MHLRLHDLSKAFDRQPVFSGLNAELRPGSVVALVGPNGSGKTTLLCLLAGMIFPDSGDILYEGRPFDRECATFRRRLFFLPEAPVLIETYTPIQHAAMVFGFYDQGTEAQHTDLLQEYEALQILEKADTPLNKLSRGHRYKAALAPLLLLGCDLWLFDEPFASGMDTAGFDLFREASRRAAARGTVVVFSLQTPELAAGFADQVIPLAGP